MHNNNAVRLYKLVIGVSGTLVALLIVANASAEIESSLALSSVGGQEPSRQEALANAMQQYHRAFESGLYDEAATSAARYISLLLKDQSFEKRDWANALVHLGNAQRRTTDYGAAIENYELAIEALMQETNRLDESLIKPYLAAGETMAESGQFLRATGMLEYAVHLQQVNGGLYNIEQAALLSQLSAVYLELGDHSRAMASQTANLNVVDQNYPGDDMRKTPVMLAHARMLAETGQMVDSHTVYRRTISMIERVEGSLSPELLPAYYEMVDFITNNEILDGFDGLTRGKRFLQRAIYVAEQSDEATPVHRADAYIEMGDFLASNTMNRNGALRNYEKAWANLAGDETLEDSRDERFGRPTLLNPLPRETAPDMRNLLIKLDKHGGDPDTLVLLRFDVDAEGFPQNVELVEDIADAYWARLGVDHVNRFIFRPRLENGEASETRDLEWSFNFRALDEDLGE